jgi:hypothetical protein
MAGPEIQIIGVTFETLQMALTDLYFRHKDMTKEQFIEAMQYVVPMQHNIENPIHPGTQDTWIQYWIDEDDRITQDFSRGNWNSTRKLAFCTIRFLGRRAEVWARAFHHLTKRKDSSIVFLQYCKARLLEYVGPIVPRNVDYFGVGNTTKAFSISFRLQYDEIIDFSQGTAGADRLEYVSFPAGGIINQEVEGGQNG